MQISKVINNNGQVGLLSRPCISAKKAILYWYKSLFWFALVVILTEIKPEALLQIIYRIISISFLDYVWKLNLICGSHGFE